MKFIKPFAALVLGLLLAASAIAQEQAPKAGGTPKLVMESSTHDFGQVKTGTPLQYAFKIKNEGSADLLIQNVQPG
jgi:hypothetical protein